MRGRVGDTVNGATREVLCAQNPCERVRSRSTSFDCSLDGQLSLGRRASIRKNEFYDEVPSEDIPVKQNRFLDKLFGEKSSKRRRELDSNVAKWNLGSGELADTNTSLAKRDWNKDVLPRNLKDRDFGGGNFKQRDFNQKPIVGNKAALNDSMEKFVLSDAPSEDTNKRAFGSPIGNPSSSRAFTLGSKEETAPTEISYRVKNRYINEIKEGNLNGNLSEGGSEIIAESSHLSLSAFSRLKSLSILPVSLLLLPISIVAAALNFSHQLFKVRDSVTHSKQLLAFCLEKFSTLLRFIFLVFRCLLRSAFLLFAVMVVALLMTPIKLIAGSLFHVINTVVRSLCSLIDSCSVESRLNGAVIVLGCCVCGVVFRLYSLQGIERKKWEQIASKQHVSSIRVQGARGPVVDSLGRSLAVSVKAVSVGIHPHLIKDIELFSRQMAPLVGKSAKEVAELAKQQKNFVWLARGLPLSVGDAVAKAGLVGTNTVEEFRRFYPQGALAAPILGLVSRDGDGLSGIERRFETELRAPDIKLAVSRDARGHLITAPLEPQLIRSTSRPLGPFPVQYSSLGGERENSLGGESVRAEGSTVQLSLDTVVQGILEEEFLKAKDDTKAKQVFGIIMDADSGEILGIGETSGFDPNAADGISPETIRSNVLQNNFEPGSTIKPLIAASALEAGVIRKDEQIDCQNGSLKVGKHTVRDVHPAGVLTIEDILVRSSNVCMAKIGLRMGRERLSASLHALGFGKPTGIELSGEAGGILRANEKWAEIDQATHAFGQGVSVTALQMVGAYAALANGGKVVTPTLLKRNSILESGKQTREMERRIFSVQSATAVSEMIVGVTVSEHGTGKNAAIAGMKVHGKTGTAQKPRVGGRGYDPERVLGSFIGYVDGKEVGVERKLVMFVAVDEPGIYPRWGGTVAAPVFKRVISRVLSHFLSVGVSSPSGVQVEKPVNGNPLPFQSAKHEDLGEQTRS